jgi:hypothetical protein
MRLIARFSVILGVALTSVFAGTVVAPGAFQNTEGGVGFNSLAPNGGVGDQYLELVLSSNFSGPVQITGVDLRLRDSNDCPGCTPFATTLANFTVKVATTSKTDTSDNTFNDYLTTNVSTVINGSLPVSSADSGPSTGPTAFDIHFGFSSPYSYDPASGNLVVWMAIADSTGAVGIPSNEQMDAVAGSSVFRIFGGYFQGGIGSCNCVYQPTGIGDNFGYVMQFDTAAAGGVPEPAPVYLIVPTIGWIAMRLRRRRSHC